jgi:hypothetical protein
MAEKEVRRPQRTRHLKDARGRRVTQLDPVSMRLVRQHDVIPAETLRKLAAEVGVGWPTLVKLTFFVMLVFLVVCLLVILVWLARDLVSRGTGLDAFANRLSVLIPPLAALLMIWFVSARVRFKRIRSIFLKYNRCPHCGYDLRLLPTDPADGATICPECGCAWQLAHSAAGDHADG